MIGQKYFMSQFKRDSDTGRAVKIRSLLVTRQGYRHLSLPVVWLRDRNVCAGDTIELSRDMADRLIITHVPRGQE